MSVTPTEIEWGFGYDLDEVEDYLTALGPPADRRPGWSAALARPLRYAALTLSAFRSARVSPPHTP